MISIKLIAICLSFAVFLFVIELVRRERLTFKYAIGWLFISFLAILFSFFDKFLFKCSSWLGFELPSNFIFFALLFVFVLWSLLLSIFLCQQNKRNDIIAQKIGIIESELNDLKCSKNIKEKNEKE